MDTKTKAAFEKALNNFDAHPLKGQTLKDFYVDTFTKRIVKKITNDIRLYSKTKKILVIGHRGCGKSTILNKVAEGLDKEYHVVSFSVLTELNRYDVEIVDLLLTIYMQLLKSSSEENSKHVSEFDKIMKPVREKLHLTEVGLNLIRVITLKFKKEEETRVIIRKTFLTQIDELHTRIKNVCVDLFSQLQKDVLIIIDDLDKLEFKSAENIFIKQFESLTIEEARTVFTFPLETHYSQTFNPVRNQYEEIFLPLINVHAASGDSETVYEELKELIFKRIDPGLIEESALRIFIKFSGGLLRDLIHFLQNGCDIALLDESNVITKAIAEEVVKEFIIGYERSFDFTKYGAAAELILKNHHRKNVDQLLLSDLLKFLFVLEYRPQNNAWFDLHPCLREVMRKYEVTDD